ncbi:hypothetical protein KC906_00620 [Candidatus Kaiserbacteria bacterium]|nr:hypothetical protein [Candidatus Kaiserbacteria bacterium]MCB9812132.1 hypothetical protein [Candidatus Nomurabacteria bacterium]
MKTGRLAKVALIVLFMTTATSNQGSLLGSPGVGPTDLAALVATKADANCLANTDQEPVINNDSIAFGTTHGSTVEVNALGMSSIVPLTSSPQSGYGGGAHSLA